MAGMDSIIVHHSQQLPHSTTLSQVRDVSQATNTAELTKMIRQASDALDAEMRVPNANYFAPHIEALRSDCLELFRRLLVRNPYSSHRKDIASKMWFRVIYPSIEKYRVSIKQYEAMLQAGSSSSASSSSTALTSLAASANANTAAAYPTRDTDTAKPDAIAIRRELSKWRARLQTFLQASAGVLLRMVVELAETHALVAAGSLDFLAGCALDARTLATHAYGFDFVDCLRSELHPALSSVQRATLAIISKLLTHLGDLSRYRILYTSKKQSSQPQGPSSATTASTTEEDADSSSNSTDDIWWAAKNFYRAAIRIAPHRGQPHNQIAVIHGYEKNTLDGTFHYYRALSAQYGFMPSEANLRTFFDNALRVIDDPEDKTQQQQQLQQQKQRQQHGRRLARSRASVKNVGGTTSSSTGYAYYDKHVYARFNHLRYLFSHHCPTAADIAALGPENSATSRAMAGHSPMSPQAQEHITSEISLACEKFVHGAKSGLIDERQALMTQGIHLFEQQHASCLNANAKETSLHDPIIAKLSALLAMHVAEDLCFGVSRSIADAMGSQKGGGGSSNNSSSNSISGSSSSTARLSIKSPSDLLSNPSRRTIPLIVQTLMWTVSACVRVVKDSTSRDYLAAHGGAPITELKSQVFKAIRDSGLLASMRKLRAAMEQAHAKISRRSPLTAPVTWNDTLASMDNLTRHIWALSAASGGTAAQRGYEPELLDGWLLPDGSVWGRLAPAEGPGHSMLLQQRSSSAHSDISEDTRLLALWKQLYWLLSVSLDAVPMVLGIVDHEEKIRQAAKMQPRVKDTLENRLRNPEILLHENSLEDNDEDSEFNDDDDAENETICFQGRPQRQSQSSVAAAPAIADVANIPPMPQRQRRSSATSATSPLASDIKSVAAGPSQVPAESQASVPPTPQTTAPRQQPQQQPQKQPQQHRAQRVPSVPRVPEQLLSDLWRTAARQQQEQGSLTEDGESESTESAMRMIEQMELAKETRNHPPAALSSGHSSNVPSVALSPDLSAYYLRPSLSAGTIGSRFQGSAIAAATAIPPASAAQQQQQQQQQQHAATGQIAAGSMSPDDVYRTRQQISAVTSALYSPQLLPLGTVGSDSGITGNHTAIDAWQQYQVEHQRKLVLRQQLEQQQRLQLQLQQQLLGQRTTMLQGNGNNGLTGQYQQQAMAMASAADQLDMTTASVVNMALSAPNEKQNQQQPSDLSSMYNAYRNFSARGDGGGGSRHVPGAYAMPGAPNNNTGNRSGATITTSPAGFYQYPLAYYQQQQTLMPMQHYQGQHLAALPPVAHSVSYPHPMGNMMPPGTAIGNSSMNASSAAAATYPWTSPMLPPSKAAAAPGPPIGNNSSNSAIDLSSFVGYLSPMMLGQKSLPHQQSHHHQQQYQYPIAGASSGSATTHG
ncbi:hypothetical protein GGI23_000409 [Coemansia sp. RSA 2559]|nr:hypothetical protein GGI23_000409 [Coemansia sp. RSA 2559]KAJ2869242.1 hypothetical protein GGI22_000371 [Coemansia erecta]